MHRSTRVGPLNTLSLKSRLVCLCYVVRAGESQFSDVCTLQCGCYSSPVDQPEARVGSPDNSCLRTTHLNSPRPFRVSRSHPWTQVRNAGNREGHFSV